MIDLVTIKKFEELSGYTVDAINSKISISGGVWLEGQVWKKAPDGRRLISISGCHAWAEGRTVVLKGSGISRRPSADR